MFYYGMFSISYCLISFIFFIFFIEHKMLKNDVLVVYCNHAMFYMFLFLFHVDCDMRNFLVHFPLKESKS